MDVRYLAALLATHRVLSDEVRSGKSGISYALIGVTRSSVTGGQASALASSRDRQGGGVGQAEAILTSNQRSGASDIWDDKITLHLLLHGSPPGGTSASELQLSLIHI